MSPWTGQEVARITGGNLRSGAETTVTGVSTDSRTVQPGQLFVPLVGEHHDGHRFITDAVARGCGGYLAQPGCVVDPEQKTLAQVVVPDTLQALGDLAADHLGRARAATVAITGSNGKTSTKEMLALALGAYGVVAKNPGNHNNLIGLPLAALSVTDECDYVVLEMGMNRPGEIGRLTEIVQPDVGVVTTIAAAHLEGLHTLEGVTWAKGELFAGLSSSACAVVATYDTNIRRIAEGIDARTLTVGENGADVAIEAIRRTGVGGYSAKVSIGEQSYTLRLRTLARHEVWNAALVVGVLAALGLDPAPGIAALAHYQAVEGRICWRVSPRGVNVIDDTYNANPASMKSALRSLGEVALGARTIAVLGDMLEMGGQAPAYHEEVGRFAAELGVDYLFAVGTFAEAIVRGFGSSDCHEAADCQDVLEPLCSLVEPGDWVLVKGSRGMRMERAVNALALEGLSS
jgi:UDP-N-acetylmuramoyl-tripeptide--D-alanyl-D-alanine ligase